MKKAFTLAEVLSVLIILGVVAVLTIPSTLQRTKERSNRTKIVKAMAAWEQFVPMFLSDNSIFNEEQAAEVFNNAEDCDIVMKYFKIKKVIDRRGQCRFETYDGILWIFDAEMYDDKEATYKQGLSAKVQFADKSKIMIEGHEVELPTDKKADYFRFYFHYSPENNALYINDPEHVPWYRWQGSNWCGSHPFGHGCWSGMLEYDSTALLPWQYLKMVEYRVYNYNF